MSNVKVAGIDYSMTCSAITIFEAEEGTDFSYDLCSCYYYIDKKKFDITVDNIYGSLAPKWTEQMERFDNIARWTIDLVRDCDFIGLEGYSMGSKGKVFNIAENTGIMKHSLWKNQLHFESIPPSVIKKFATGKGNADKFKMNDQFISETGVVLKEKLNQTEKQWSPSGDIVDSYFIAKYVWNELVLT